MKTRRIIPNPELSSPIANIIFDHADGSDSFTITTKLDGTDDRDFLQENRRGDRPLFEGSWIVRQFPAHVTPDYPAADRIDGSTAGLELHFDSLDRFEKAVNQLLDKPLISQNYHDILLEAFKNPEQTVFVNQEGLSEETILPDMRLSVLQTFDMPTRLCFVVNTRIYPDAAPQMKANLKKLGLNYLDYFEGSAVRGHIDRDELMTVFVPKDNQAAIKFLEGLQSSSYPVTEKLPEIISSSQTIVNQIEEDERLALQANNEDWLTRLIEEMARLRDAKRVTNNLEDFLTIARASEYIPGKMDKLLKTLYFKHYDEPLNETDVAFFAYCVFLCSQNAADVQEINPDLKAFFRTMFMKRGSLVPRLNHYRFAFGQETGLFAKLAYSVFNNNIDETKVLLAPFTYDQKFLPWFELLLDSFHHASLVVLAYLDNFYQECLERHPSQYPCKHLYPNLGELIESKRKYMGSVKTQAFQSFKHALQQSVQPFNDSDQVLVHDQEIPTSLLNEQQAPSLKCSKPEYSSIKSSGNAEINPDPSSLIERFKFYEHSWGQYRVSAQICVRCPETYDRFVDDRLSYFFTPEFIRYMAVYVDSSQIKKNVNFGRVVRPSADSKLCLRNTDSPQGLEYACKRLIEFGYIGSDYLNQLAAIAPESFKKLFSETLPEFLNASTNRQIPLTSVGKPSGLPWTPSIFPGAHQTLQEIPRIAAEENGTSVFIDTSKCLVEQGQGNDKTSYVCAIPGSDGLVGRFTENTADKTPQGCKCIDSGCFCNDGDHTVQLFPPSVAFSLCNTLTGLVVVSTLVGSFYRWLTQKVEYATAEEIQALQDRIAILDHKKSSLIQADEHLRNYYAYIEDLKEELATGIITKDNLEIGAESMRFFEDSTTYVSDDALKALKDQLSEQGVQSNIDPKAIVNTSTKMSKWDYDGIISLLATIKQDQSGLKLKIS